MCVHAYALTPAPSHTHIYTKACRLLHILYEDYLFIFTSKVKIYFIEVLMVWSWKACIPSYCHFTLCLLCCSCTFHPELPLCLWFLNLTLCVFVSDKFVCFRRGQSTDHHHTCPRVSGQRSTGKAVLTLVIMIKRTLENVLLILYSTHCIANWLLRTYSCWKGTSGEAYLTSQTLT